MTNNIGDLSLANNHYNGYYIPWKYIAEDISLADKFTRLSLEKQIIGANLKFDIMFI